MEKGALLLFVDDHGGLLSLLGSLDYSISILTSGKSQVSRRCGAK